MPFRAITRRHTAKSLLGCLVLAALMGKVGFSQGPDATISINPAKPPVFVSFDHIVRPPLSRRDIDSDLLFLRIKNNSRTRIQVLASASEAGADGLELVHEIVQASSLRGYAGLGNASGPGKPASGWVSPPEHYSPVDVAATVDIQPNTDLLFSVPLNHVGPSWGLQLTFQFVLHKVRGHQPQAIVDFTWADVPIKERSAWKSDSSK